MPRRGSPRKWRRVPFRLLTIRKNQISGDPVDQHLVSRESVVRCTIHDKREKLSGRVEVDEFLIGAARSGKRGRGAEGKTIVAVAVER